MKVGFLIQTLSSGGAERATASLANEMNKNGVDVKIVTFNSESSFYPLDDGVELVNMNLEKFPVNKIKKLFSMIKRMFTIRKIIKSQGFDALICMNSVLAGYGVFSTLLTKTKTIGSERNNPYKYFNSKPLVIAKKISSVLSDGYIFQTEAAKKYYPSSMHKKSAVIPNAVFNPMIGEIEPAEIRQKIIYGVGRLSPQKRLDCLIDAFSIVSEKHPDYKLVIFGEGDLREDLQNQIDKLNLSEKAILPGADKEALKFVSKGSVFVLSSEYEGMPNALMEAMAVGVPCVSTRCKMGPEELIDDGYNGILVSDGCSKDELASGICRIIENEELADRLSQNSRKLIETHSVSAICESWLDYLNRVTYCKGNCFTNNNTVK